MLYTLEKSGTVLSLDAATGMFSLKFGQETWQFDAAPVEYFNGTKRHVKLEKFTLASAEQSEDCLAANLLLHYTCGRLALSMAYRLFDGFFEVSAEMTGESESADARLYFPAALRFGEAPEDVWTILPQMQGEVIPARYPRAWRPVGSVGGDSWVYGRDAYMAFFAYTKGEESLLAIYGTPYDMGYSMDHPGGSHTLLRPYAKTSLGQFRYKRVMRYTFVKSGKIIDVAKAYRAYADEYGRARTLKEKEAVNPAIKRLYGAPVVHAGGFVDISPESALYDQEHPERNRHVTPFALSAERLEALYAKGVRGAYLHFDGWNRAGYDREVPDMFPPAEACGGLEGFRHLAETAQKLGYVFGIHDQYRDYYYSAPSFSLDLAVKNGDGTNPFGSYWYGGRQTVLCSEYQPHFVKRNYGLLKEAGVKIEAAYLDVFSACELDECFHPLHRVTREECAANRCACIEYLNRQGIITSSEEAIESMLPSIALCHHAPFAVNGDPFYHDDKCTEETMGPAIPLMAMVYHDCIVTPWPGAFRKSGWGMMDHRDLPAMWAALTGSPVYIEITETKANLKKAKPLLNLHKRVATQKIVDFGFIDGDLRRQFTVFEDGTRVTVNHDTFEYSIEYPEKG